MANRFSIFALTALASLSLNEATAQSGTVGLNGQINTITTAVPFLRITPDSRGGAMGDVGIATSADANGQYYNIGKMAFNKNQFGGAINVTPWLRGLELHDIYIGYLSGYTKFGTDLNQSISASLRYFQLGNIDYTDINAEPIGTGMPREWSFDVGYSRKLSEYLSAGVALRYIYSNIATGAAAVGGYNPGKAVAADLGLYYTKTTEVDEFKSNTLSAGIALTNLGSKISYSNVRSDYIPANLGLGLAYGMKIDEYNSITFGLDINKLLVPTPQMDTSGVYYIPEKPIVGSIFGSFGDAPGGFGEEMREFQFGLGAEYWYQNQFAVRAGYFYEDKTKGARKYFTVGLGVKYKAMGLDFAYLVASGSGVNRNPLSNTLRFSLLFEGNAPSREVSGAN